MNGIVACVLFDKQRFCHKYYMWGNLSLVVQNASAFTDFACSVKKQLGQIQINRGFLIIIACGENLCVSVRVTGFIRLNHSTTKHYFWITYLDY